MARVSPRGAGRKGGGASSSHELREVAACLLAELDERERRFAALSSADPDWNMLLDLYVCACDDRKVAVTSLCIASRVPPTTALRWISYLVEKGMVSKQADPNDGRRFFVAITDAAFDQMTAYLAAIAKRRDIC